MKISNPPKQRSEDIRKRRFDESHTARQTTRQRKDRVITPAPPPVMTRTPLTGASRPQKKGNQKNRRIYNLNLDAAHGSEMRVPALPRIGLSWRFVSILIAGFLGFALYQLWESPEFRVDAPKINGLKSLNSNQINTGIGLIGARIIELNANSIQSDLLSAFPELSSAEVAISFPNSVLITVTERIPVLTWTRDGESFLVDSQGIRFPLREGISVGSTPVVEAAGDPPSVFQQEEEDGLSLRESTIQKITGSILPGFSMQEQAKPLLPPELVRSILLVSEKAPAGSKLVYDPVHGIGWLDRRGWNVYLGDAQEIEVKLQTYRVIMDQLKASENRPTMISVEYVHAPYYRME